ncbi:MAG: hypothetical protein ACI9PP_000854 [Halobacteriales archaeon]
MTTATPKRTRGTAVVTNPRRRSQSFVATFSRRGCRIGGMSMATSGEEPGMTLFKIAPKTKKPASKYSRM